MCLISSLMMVFCWSGGDLSWNAPQKEHPFAAKRLLPTITQNLNTRNCTKFVDLAFSLRLGDMQFHALTFLQ